MEIRNVLIITWPESSISMTVEEFQELSLMNGCVVTQVDKLDFKIPIHLVPMAVRNRQMMQQVMKNSS